MLNILIIVAAFLIAVVLARIIIPRILIISLRKRLFGMKLIIKKQIESQMKSQNEIILTIKYRN